MKETSIYAYYAFGYNYSIWKVHWAQKKVSVGIDELSEYLYHISALELQVTGQVVSALKRELESQKNLSPMNWSPKTSQRRFKRPWIAQIRLWMRN